MAINADRIIKPTSNLYRGVTIPATVADYIAGWDPATGTFTLGSAVHLGATGIPDFNPAIETVDKDSQNQMGILGTAVSKHTCELTIRMLEWTREGMLWALNGEASGANGIIGGHTTTIAESSYVVVIKLDDTPNYGYIHLFNAQVSSLPQMSFDKENFLESEVTLKGSAYSTGNYDGEMYKLYFPDDYLTFAT